MTMREAREMREHVRIVTEAIARKDQRIQDLEFAIRDLQLVRLKHAAGECGPEMVLKVEARLFEVMRTPA